MAYTNSIESTTEDLAGLEQERSERGDRPDLTPIIAGFALGGLCGRWSSCVSLPSAPDRHSHVYVVTCLSLYIQRAKWCVARP